MNIEETSLPGVLLITPKIHSDNRGAFWETWNHKAFEAAGLPCTWVQDNFSLSKKNVVRGIHYQTINPQGKLVRATHGAVLDVAVDLRRNSPCFGEHVAVELSGENGRMLWIPEGFGHGFLVLSDVAGLRLQGHGFLQPQRRAHDCVERSGTRDCMAGCARGSNRLRQGCERGNARDR